MQSSESAYTKHARDRSTARAIPFGIIEMIRDYGRPVAARDGAHKIALDKRGMREVRRDYGPEVAKALQPYRRAYVVEQEGMVLTAAFSPKPLFC